ncbi:MAG: hypothetical protein MUC82_07780 [Cypionkella sp.]|jgi:hypothetical protein|nr:hypothetical protein [Cypionkella sp.]
MATRRLTAFAALGLTAVVVLTDLATSAPLDPFRAPPAIALGSGQATSGAHCAALPGQ